MTKQQVGFLGAGTAMTNDFASALIQGIDESRSTTIIAGGKALLRLLKRGDWVFGPGDEEVQPGSAWAVNVMTIQHGWNCWSKNEGNAKNELLGEQMVPIFDAKPARPEPIQGFPWTEERAFDLKCLDGDDEGTEVLYKTNSVGGMRAVDGLLAAVRKQISTPEGRAYPCPVLQLDSSSYKHPKHGEIFNPILTISDWMSGTGELQSQAGASEGDEPPFEPTEIEPPKKAAKASLKKDPPAAPAAPAATAAMRSPGVRRRPAARV